MTWITTAVAAAKAAINFIGGAKILAIILATWMATGVGCRSLSHVSSAVKVRTIKFQERRACRRKMRDLDCGGGLFGAVEDEPKMSRWDEFLVGAIEKEDVQPSFEVLEPIPLDQDSLDPPPEPTPAEPKE